MWSIVVSDFRPAESIQQKIKKESLPEGGRLTLEFVQNPDILQEISARKGDRTIVGFAAESHDVVAAAKRKLLRKGCDLMVANDISRAEGRTRSLAPSSLFGQRSYLESAREQEPGAQQFVGL